MHEKVCETPCGGIQNAGHNANTGQPARKKLYIDNTRQGDGPMGVFVKDTQVIYTGTRIHTEPERIRGQQIVRDAARWDVWFFFDGDEITQDLYTVPFTESFARDSRGGRFVKEPDEDAPVYYIAPDRQVRKVAENFSAFLGNLQVWKENMRPDPALAVFSSREAAQRVYRIHDMEERIAEYR